MMYRVVVSLALVVALMHIVSGSKTVKCYQCDNCATTDSNTETCEGNACKIVVSLGVVARSCATSTKTSCTIQSNGGLPTFTCVCKNGNFCTGGNECGCVDLTLGSLSTGDLNNNGAAGGNAGGSNGAAGGNGGGGGGRFGNGGWDGGNGGFQEEWGNGGSDSGTGGGSNGAAGANGAGGNGPTWNNNGGGGRFGNGGWDGGNGGSDSGTQHEWEWNYPPKRTRDRQGHVKRGKWRWA